MFWVYVLQNPAGNFYIGHTNNLENRVTNHKEPMVPNRLIFDYGQPREMRDGLRRESVP